MKNSILSAVAGTLCLCQVGCKTTPKEEMKEDQTQQTIPEAVQKIYAPFTLTTDLGQLSENEKKMLPLLIEAAKIMDELFWKQSFGNKASLMDTLNDPALKTLAEINYGPWDRIGNDTAFISGFGEKAPGAELYPKDMSKEEFEQAELADKNSLYTLLRRDEEGRLVTVPYHEAYKAELQKTSDLLKQAAGYAEDEGLKNYLNLRAEALISSEYQASDLAWMDMKNNGVDIVIGPIENYEDQLFGTKAAFEAYVLVKDKAWSEKLAKYASMLPELQEGLPVEEQYKQDKPGTDSDLNAYDVVFYAGDCNAGSKTIAINLPNDEEIQQSKGTRRLQLKNAMKAKFDKILLPISDVLIDESQRKHISFDAFFANTMFHEVAHGLGIKNTINDKGTVREALQEQASALEEGKADILGLYMVTKLFEKGELEGDVHDNYVTFMAGIFRSVRFGASSAHGKANMLRFNYFKEKGAFVRNPETGTYKVDFDKMEEAMNSLSALILKLQGDGDYEGVNQLMVEKGTIEEELASDLARLSKAHIPVDIVFEQGVEVLGLTM
ncbi:Zn-dependent hydrolase [Rapidithrix thailandica]|uniref:Zn-dependent hydrolase n=1 Tax=Rapidithrix thailandica TaxID=413964 RepID=A0AAW9SDS7_9BACT